MKQSAAGIIVLLLLTFLLSGCGDDNTIAIPPDLTGKPVATPNFAPVTTIGQFIPTTDGAVAPGMANYWDIGQNFSLVSSSDYQFDTAMTLQVGATPFPADQVHSELTFFTPPVGAAEGARTVRVSNDTTSWYVPIAGVYSAYLYPTGHSVLEQTVNLTAATGPVTFNCNLDGASWLGSIPGGPETFRIVIRNLAGTELEELYLVNGPSVSPPPVDLTAYIGSKIVLSFESTGQFEPVVIDNVSVTDGSAVEFITNGDFESGTLAPWVANSAANMLQNIRAGIRTVEGLDVTRSFYTVPDKLWGRWVDVFSNPTGSAITKTISYNNDLGSDEFGIIYFTPGSSNQAVTSWSGAGFGRDIALVFGDATTVAFTSDDGLGNGNGTGLIPTTYDITVPAGGKVAIVNFIVMGGTDTGSTAIDITATADEVDAVAKAIVKNFWTDPQYRTGMTQAQIEAISNF